CCFFFFQAEDGIRDRNVTGVQTCALPILRRWKVAREEWAKNEKPARAAMKIFETLYALHGRIDREAERVELVLGDGILSWSRAEIGRASCRERVEIWVGAGSLNKRRDGV